MLGWGIACNQISLGGVNARKPSAVPLCKHYVIQETTCAGRKATRLVLDEQCFQSPLFPVRKSPSLRFARERSGMAGCTTRLPSSCMILHSTAFFGEALRPEADRLRRPPSGHFHRARPARMRCHRTASWIKLTLTFDILLTKPPASS